MTQESVASTVSAAERVATVIRDEIASGVFRPDEPLPPENILIQRFGLSRPTVREALRILQSEGLLSPVRGNRGGARIMAPDPERLSVGAGVFLQRRGTTILEIFEARALVEPEAAAMVARLQDRAVLSMLAQNVAAQRFLVGDRVAFYAAGREFRTLMIEHCGSETIRLLGLVLGSIVDRQLSMLAEKLPYVPGQELLYNEAIDLKDEMIAAMIDRKADDARALWKRYLDHYVASLVENTPEWLRNADPFPLTRKT